MKACHLASIFVFGMALSLRPGWGDPVDLSAPSGGLGAANSKGYLEIWREIDDVGLQLGKGSYLPLRYKFSTDPTTAGVLGPGFYMPMFEAKNVLIRESTMRAYLPCGKGLYMWRDNVDPNKFRSVDDKWTGYLTGDDYVVWRDDGWKVQYHKSRLSSITSDDGHVFTWTYDQSGLPQGVSENGQTLITVEPNAAGQIAAITYNGKRYELEYAERPITQMLLGQVGIKELDQALSSFKYPDGRTDTFNFILSPDRVPTLNFRDKNKVQTSYTWLPANDYIASETGTSGDWRYAVGEIVDPFASPALSRTNQKDGKTEGMTVDNKTGTYAATEKDGTQVVTHVFETPGSLYHKIRSVDKLINGVSTVIYRASYDDAGRLIRKVDAKGFTILYSYDDKGKFLQMSVTAPSDPAILAVLKKKESDILTRLSKITSAQARGSLLEQLAFLYIHDFGTPDKALALLPEITDRKQAFNVQMHSIDGDNSLTGVQKAEKFKALLQKYPEEKHLLDVLIEARPRDDLMNVEKMNSQYNS